MLCLVPHILRCHLAGEAIEPLISASAPKKQLKEMSFQDLQVGQVSLLPISIYQSLSALHSQPWQRKCGGENVPLPLPMCGASSGVCTEMGE